MNKIILAVIAVFILLALVFTAALFYFRPMSNFKLMFNSKSYIDNLIEYINEFL
jgi:hypothetical protein